MVYKILFLLLAYLIGSVPFGYLLGRLKGHDLLKEGSQNIGATNAGRVLGKKYAILTYAFDMIKSFLFVFLFNYKILPVEWCVLNPMLYGLVANLGHCFSIFLKFKGGKSVACASGAVAGYCPYLLPVMLILFFIIKKIGGLVSLSSLLTTFITVLIGIGISIFKGTFYFINIHTYEIGTRYPYDAWFCLFLFLIALLLFLKHIPNIRRIIKGEEKPVHY